MAKSNYGGFRAGAGRPKKTAAPLAQGAVDERTRVMKADERQVLKVLADEAKKGTRWAVELWMAYMYGKPTERQEIADARAKTKETLTEQEILDRVEALARAAESAKTKAAAAGHIEPSEDEDDAGDSVGLILLDGTDG